MSKLAEQLKMFPKLRVLDLSRNPGLDRASIFLFIDALQGKLAFIFVFLFIPPTPILMLCISYP